MKEKLTKRQKEVFNFIKANLRQMAPTFKQIKAHFGFRSNQAVFDHLSALKKKGYIGEKYLPITYLKTLSVYPRKNEKNNN